MSQQEKIHIRTKRVALKPLPRPYYRTISKGLAIGYYKGARGGTWVARFFSTATNLKKTSLGIADDASTADGNQVLSYDQAVLAAQNWMRQLIEHETGQIIASAYTVENACADYLKDKEREKGVTMHQDRSTINAHIVPALGKIELSKLTHGKVKGWRDGLADSAPRVRTKPGKPQQFSERTKSKATVNKCLNVLKAILNYAKTEKRAVATDAAWCDVMPFRGADQPKVRFLSSEELKAFVPACEPHFQQLVKGAILTGARYGELTSLLVQHFSEDDGTIFIAKSKNGEARFVHLNQEGIDFFKRVTSDRSDDACIFVKANGKPWMKSEQKRPMDEACDATKIEGVTFHILRHTYASHALKNKMPLEVLKEQLGHKTLAITIRHYAHLCDDYKRQSVLKHAPSFGFNDDAKPFIVKTA